MDAGTLGSAFSQVTTYIDNSMSHTLTNAANGIVSGTIYTFKFKAKNTKNYS